MYSTMRRYSERHESREIEGAEGDRPHRDDRQNHHSHPDAGMNERRHEGHKQEARREREARTERDRQLHNTEGGGGGGTPVEKEGPAPHPGTSDEVPTEADGREETPEVEGRRG